MNAISFCIDYPLLAYGNQSIDQETLPWINSYATVELSSLNYISGKLYQELALLWKSR